jgi:hypothetical protein
VGLQAGSIMNSCIEMVATADVLALYQKEQNIQMLHEG